jgi:hypothetical protein
MIACIACSEIAMGLPLLLYPLWLFLRPICHKYFKKHGVHGNESCNCECHTNHPRNVTHNGSDVP